MLFKSLVGALFATTLAVAGWAEPLRVAVLKFGTVNWALDTIQHHGFDRANGFTLQVQGMAGGAAAKVAFQGGTTDVIVADWLWVARQRAAGKDYVFLPYSKAVGGVMVAKDSAAQTLADLRGAKIGIAGGPLDKSWLILQAYAQQAHNMNLAQDTDQVFGAPPLIFKSALTGEIKAAINYWHFTAKMEAAGLRKLVDVTHAAQALGLDPETPLLGYVIKGDMLRNRGDIVRGLASASRTAADLLAQSETEWDRLRPQMRVKSDAEFEALKAGFRAGIPAAKPVDEVAAGKMLKVMVELGGRKLLGAATELPEGTFFKFDN